MKKCLLRAICCMALSFFVLITYAQTTTYTANSGGFAYIDNGTYKIGFNLDYGGAIDYVSKSNETTSMVNSYDNGRQVGIDAYNGPHYNNDPVYKNQGYIDACESQGVLCSTAGSAWNGLPQGNFSGLTGGAPNSISWNPTTQTLTIVSKLWDWNLRNASDLSKVYDQAEQTQELKFVAPNVLKVIYTTSMHINYLTGTYILQQVSPYLYLNGNLNKLATYTGGSPFTNDPNIYNQVIPNVNPSLNSTNQDAKEKWGGLYDANDYGFGMVWKDNYQTIVAGTNDPSNTNNGRYSGKASFFYHVVIPSSLTGNSTVVNEVYYVFGSPNDARCWAYSLNGYSSSCGAPTGCAFTPAVTSSNSTPAAGSSFTLTASCSGADCSGVTYTWSGTGVSGTGSSKTVTAPSAGTYTYTVTASKNGCSSQTASTTITVPGGTSYNQCQEAELSTGNGPVTSDPNASNGSTRGAESNYNHYVDYVVTGVPSAGNYTATLTYYSSSAPVVGVQVNGGTSQTVNLSNSGSWNIVTTTQSFTVSLAAGTNTIRVTGTGGGSARQDKLCVTGTGSGCTTPAAPTLSASPATITTTGGSSTLSAAGCSGVVTWSDGLGTGTSKSVSPTATKTYTATCTVIGGCVSAPSSVVVNVNTGTPPSYNQCIEAESSTGNGAITSDPNASNGSTRGEQSNANHYVDYVLTSVPAAGTYYVTLRYYSSAAPIVGVQVNGGTSQTVNLSNSGSWNIVWTTQQFTVNLAAGTNTLRISGTGGGSCRQDRICVSNSAGGSAALLGVDPSDLGQLQARPMTIAPNPSKGIFETQFYLEKGRKATLLITDLQGRVIYRQAFAGHGQHREKISLPQQASGILIVQLQKDGAAEIKKITINR